MMRAKEKFGALTFLITIVLIGMVLARLVWLQLRDHNSSIMPRAWVTVMAVDSTFGSNCVIQTPLKLPENSLDKSFTPSPGFAVYISTLCLDGLLAPSDLVRWNQWILVSLIAFSALTIRLVTGTWIGGIAVAAMLLSRGSLLRSVGDVSYDPLVALSLAAWTFATIHFFATGARLGLITSLVASLIGTLTDPALIVTFLPIPLLFAPLSRLFQSSSTKLSGWGRPLTPIPLGAWISGPGNLFRTLRACLIAAAGGMIYVAWALSTLPSNDNAISSLSLHDVLDWFGQWSREYSLLFDTHLSLSLILTMVGAILPSRRTHGSHNLYCQLVLVAFGLVLISASLFDLAEVAGWTSSLGMLGSQTIPWDYSQGRHVSLWLEPILLSSGAGTVVLILRTLVGYPTRRARLLSLR